VKRKATRKRNARVPEEQRREKLTLLPSFDADELAREVESTPSIRAASPFDPGAYARIVDPTMSLSDEARFASERDVTPVDSSSYDHEAALERHDTLRIGSNVETTETLGRSMYGSYLESDYPRALGIAERLLEADPDHKLAELVAARCRARLARSDDAPLHPSSVLRLKAMPNVALGMAIEPVAAFVLEHLDGVIDAATVAELTGLPRDEALERLHELLDLGLVEVVSA
jgi:hypothetical protein